MSKSINNLVETVLGFLVIAVAAGFCVYTYQYSQMNTAYNGYSLEARFDRIDGLNVGSDIKLSGVKIGYVKTLEIDPKTYQAKATLFLNEDIKIPTDSIAEVSSDGLLGGKYIAIVPGGDETMLQEKEAISETHSSISFEALLSKFVFSSAKDEKKDEKSHDHSEKTQDDHAKKVPELENKSHEKQTAVEEEKNTAKEMMQKEQEPLKAAAVKEISEQPKPSRFKSKKLDKPLLSSRHLNAIEENEEATEEATNAPLDTVPVNSFQPRALKRRQNQFDEAPPPKPLRQQGQG